MAKFYNFSNLMTFLDTYDKNIRCLVIGDIILDQYVQGDVKRISPEAPIPILSQIDTSYCLGGAANVANNLRQLNLNVWLCGFVGQDYQGNHIYHLLRQAGIYHDLVIGVENYQTVTKYRFVSNNQQLLRVDLENIPIIESKYYNDIKIEIENLISSQNLDIIILSDYAKGVCNFDLCQFVINISKRKNIPVLVDPKGKDIQKYTGAYALLPNQHDLENLVDTSMQSLEDIILYGKYVLETLGLQYLTVTLGKDGMVVVTNDNIHKISALEGEALDVSGAGDTVMAGMAFGLSAGLSYFDSSYLATLAAKIVIGKLGTSSCSIAEIKNQINMQLNKNIRGFAYYDLQKLQKVINQWRQDGNKIVFTNGCFDILHIGHIEYLAESKEMGDKLIVGINSDESVEYLKGNHRPINPIENRVKIIASLRSVDAVIVFQESNPLRIIKAIKPDVLVKGADYKLEEIVGAEEVKSWNGTVVNIPLVPGVSTSQIIDKIRKIL